MAAAWNFRASGAEGAPFRKCPTKARKSRVSDAREGWQECAQCESSW